LYKWLYGIVEITPMNGYLHSTYQFFITIKSNKKGFSTKSTEKRGLFFLPKTKEEIHFGKGKFKARFYKK
jgi:hypothetical protein